MKKQFIFSCLSLTFFLFPVLGAWSQAALGHVSVEGSDGVLSLRIISVSDAQAAGHGVLKIQLEDGSVGAADLVLTSHAQASPVRVRTTYGTRSWKQERQFSYAYGGEGSDLFTGLALTSDGGLAMGGWTDSWGAGSNDQFLVKTNNSGTQSWAGAYGNVESETSYGTIQRADGGYLLLGTKSNYGISYMFLNFIDTSGASTLSGYFPLDTGYSAGYDVIQCSDGNYVGVGSVNGTGAGGYDTYVKKFDSSGDNIWGWTIGSSENETGKEIVQRPDGGYAIGGYISTESSGYNMYFLMIDSTGASEISYSTGGPDGDYAESICLAADNGFTLLGRTDSFGAGSWDFYMMKRNASGTFAWTTTIGGTGSDLGEDITCTNDGGFALTGKTNSFGAGGLDLWLIKTDSLGNPQWSWVFGGTGNESGYAVQQATDGCYYVAGIASSYGAGGNDALLVKFTPDGSTCLGYALGFSSDMQSFNENEDGFKAQRIDNFTVKRVRADEERIKPLGRESDEEFVARPHRSRDFVTPTTTTICD